MSVSLYYTTKRDYPITEQEQNNCQKIADQYIAEYPLGDMYESISALYCMIGIGETGLYHELNENWNEIEQAIVDYIDCLK